MTSNKCNESEEVKDIRDLLNLMKNLPGCKNLATEDVNGWSANNEECEITDLVFINSHCEKSQHLMTVKKKIYVIEKLKKILL